MIRRSSITTSKITNRRTTIEELIRSATSHRRTIYNHNISGMSVVANNRLLDSTISTSPTSTTQSINNMVKIKKVSLLPLMNSTSLSSSTTSLSSHNNYSVLSKVQPSSLPSQKLSCTFYSTMACTQNKNTSTALLLKNQSESLTSSSQDTTRVTLTTLPAKSTPSTFTTTRYNSTTTPTDQKEEQEESDGAMDDEYGTMNASGLTFTYPNGPYHLESFGTLGHTGPSPTTKSLPRGILNPAYLNYKTYGTLNAQRDNVLVICHALTGNASLEAWWGDLLGSGKAFDTDQYFIVCCNILGSCYGSVSPSSLRPGYDNDNDNNESNDISENIPRDKNNRAIYGYDFPDVSVRDTVRLQLLLLKHELKISSIKCVIGGSFGGMQAMEYCVMAGATRHISNGGTVDKGGSVWPQPVRMRRNSNGVSNGGSGGNEGGIPYGIGEFVTQRNGRIEPFVRSAVPIACGAAHTAWQISISETQRQAIYADVKWNNGRYDPHDPPTSGLSVARQVAMVSYRTPLGYHKKFGRALTNESGPSYGSKAPWQVKSYLEYQGKKFLDRFDPVTYVKLTEQMDSHDIGRGRGSIEEVLNHIEIPVCVLGIDSDVLYPLREQEEMVQAMPNAELKIIHSDAGHDGFLLEQDQVAAHIKSFLYSHD